MRAIIFSIDFIAPDDFAAFCKLIGYDPNKCYMNFSMMFDRRIIEFCERNTAKLWGETIYKGKDSYQYRIGFAGAGYFRDIDTTKTWRIKYNNVDSPIIEYVDVSRNDYGFLNIKPVCCS